MIVWKDASFRIHAVFYGNEFFSDSEQDVVQANVREILIHNRKNNPNYWCTCLHRMNLIEQTAVPLFCTWTM